jgi:hypothetical protein
MEHKNTWQDIDFKDLYPNRKRGLVVGMSFPRNDGNLGLEPSILSVLPQGDNVIYDPSNNDYHDGDVEYYLCSVYISGVEEFKEWAQRHDKRKIVVGGYHPTSFPSDFKNDAWKIVQGPCDDFYATIGQDGQVVSGISTYKYIPRYDLYSIKSNQQIIPGKKPNDICSSINTSIGCPYKCDFCCSPVMCPKLVSKPIELVEREVDYFKTLPTFDQPQWLFIRDENFPLQRDWKERLKLISKIGAKIYMFASANLLQKWEDVVYLQQNGVYMVCLGLEDVTVSYSKNKKLENAISMLKKVGIFTYLSFIVNPLEVIGREAGENYYGKLMQAFHDLKPEMVCGNFLMPFPGTKMWDQYYAYVSKDDYKYYDSKTPFMIRNEVLREKMKFYMFWYQWKYYTSDFYQKEVRHFYQEDTLHLRFEELNEHFRKKYYRYWDVRC